MTVIPPISGIQAGHTSGGGMLGNLMGAATSGGGLLSSLTGAAGGATQTAPGQVAPGPKGDGSVGLFDGVLKKALIGGAAGAAFGFIPFLPGGPVLGGIMGALSGAAMGMFSNWSKMKVIKTENQATMAALGVQSQDPNINKVMETGQVQQLIPMMQAQQGAVGQQTAAQQVPVIQQSGAMAGADTGPGTVPIGTQTSAGRIATVTDPATGISQRINVDTGQVVQEGSAGAGISQQQQAAAVAAGQLPAVVATAQSPVPAQGSISVGTGAAGSGAATAAINPNAAVNPGVAPALQARGGGGSAGTAGAPPAPVTGVNRSDASAVTPDQAALAEPDPLNAERQADKRKLDKAQLAKFIQSLQAQIDELKEYLAEQERSDEVDKAAAR